MKCHVPSLLQLGILLVVVGVVNVAEAPRTEYLSDLRDRIVCQSQDWGKIGYDKATSALSWDVEPIRIGRKQYDKGLGAAPGEITVLLDGQYQQFEAVIGVQPQGSNVGSVVFQVYVDGQKQFDSGVVRPGDGPRAISISVAGAEELRLVTTDAGDGRVGDMANWAKARLTRATSPPVVRKPSVPRVDVGQFARVATWDPNRSEGTGAQRVAAFPATDLFLESDVLPEADGTYVVPRAADGKGCIGLFWPERWPINEVELQFADPAAAPSPTGVQVQVWVRMSGEGDWQMQDTQWQGHWQTVPASIERQSNRWRVKIDLKAIAGWQLGVRKVRWVFPPSSQKIVLRRLSAFSNDRWETVDLRAEAQQSKDGLPATVEICNGELLGADGAALPARQTWDLSRPLELKLRYAKPMPPGFVRTALRFRLPSGTFTMLVDDVLQRECVYVKQAGVFVTRGSSALTIDQYVKQIAGRKTNLEKVRAMPDQSFMQAWEKAHHPNLDSEPMLLSLACDNRKLVLEPGGTVLAAPAVSTVSFGLISNFGSGKHPTFTTELRDGWLPIPTLSAAEAGLSYRERVFVAPFDKAVPPPSLSWLNRRGLGVVEYTIENTSPAAARASLTLGVPSSWDYKQLQLGGNFAERWESVMRRRSLVTLKQMPTGIAAEKDGKLLVYFDNADAAGLSTSLQGGVLRLEGELAPGQRVCCRAYLPLWDAKAEDGARFVAGKNLLGEAESYWRQILGAGTQITLPEPMLMNVIRAAQTHALISSRNEAAGDRIEQWGASVAYPGQNPLYYVIPSMDMLGFEDFARRALKYHVSRWQPNGLLSDGYILAGVGWSLRLIADHYALTQDKQWLKTQAPQMLSGCRWIMREREKTKKLDQRGEKVAEYGLIPPGVMCDWEAFHYYFCMSGYFYDGLEAAARALGEIGHPDAVQLTDEARQFRADILRAYHRAQANMPVVELRDGTWVPPYPSAALLPEPVDMLYPTEDHYRPGCGVYDVELGAHYMVTQRVLEPGSNDVRWMIDHQEDYQFLRDGWYDPASETHRDWFNLGGFSKVQPNLCRIGEVYAMRDDVKPFIRSYFNFAPPQINRQNLVFWEDFGPGMGAWGSTESSAYFLLLTRLMLVMERNDELWLAPFVTDRWLANGQEVAVRNAPTRFGPVSYQIKSHVDQGYVEATVWSPTRTMPEQIAIRLRHPAGKPIKTVLVNGRPHQEFSTEKQCVYVKADAGPIVVRAEF